MFRESRIAGREPKLAVRKWNHTIEFTKRYNVAWNDVLDEMIGILESLKDKTNGKAEKDKG